MTITEFLLARIKEDEAVAERAAWGWGADWRDETDHFEEWSTVHADGKSDMVGCEDGDVTKHIARHDPARVLAECAAKRAIIAKAGRASVAFDHQIDPATSAAAFALDEVLHHLAAVYAEHSDYDPTWVVR